MSHNQVFKLKTSLTPSMYVLCYEYLRLNINSRNIFFASLINFKHLHLLSTYKALSEMLYLDYFIKSWKELNEIALLSLSYKYRIWVWSPYCVIWLGVRAQIQTQPLWLWGWHFGSLSYHSVLPLINWNRALL